MQRMDSLDSTKHKTVFKKQNHRPWTPPIQKDAPVLFESNKELSVFDSDRLLIGGFSFPKVSKVTDEAEQSQKSNTSTDKPKSKEQEVQTLSTHLKIAAALEKAENIELARKKEALARNVAEEKALCAMQQLQLTESELQKAKQQLHMEQQLKTKEEFIKKSLETEIKNALRAIEDNENTIAREIEIRRIAEGKLNETLNFLAEKEHHIRLEAEKAIRDNLRDSIEREKNIQQTLEDRVKTLQNEHKDQTLKIQYEAELKIAEAEEKACFHGKAKIEAQQWLQKSQEATRQIEIQKTEVENNLAAAIQNAADQKSQCESVINDLRLQISQLNEKISLMDIANFSLKQQLSENLSKLNAARQTEINTKTHMESLSLQIQQLTEKFIAIENEKAELTTAFTDTLGKSKTLQSIANNERRLRILLEEKFSEKETREMTRNKKLFERKIFELTEKIKALEFEKSKSQEDHDNALGVIHKTKTLLANEKTETTLLEEKNKLLTEQIHRLEEAKQNEIHEKETAARKASELVAKQQELEQEKINLEEKNKLFTEQIHSLEEAKQKEIHERETAARKAAELAAKQQALEQERTSLEEKNKLFTEQIHSLEQAKQKEIHEKETAARKASELVAKQQELEQEKINLEEKNKLFTEQIYSLEQAKQKETYERETATHKMFELVAKQQELEEEKISLQEKTQLLIEQIYSLEQAKQKETNERETATHKVSELVTKHQHLEQEKTKLNEKNKLLTEQLYSLEYYKQKETSEKETAAHKVSELVAKQQHLEQEKTILEEKYNALVTKSVEFKIMLASEQALRKESERLQMIEEQARKAAEEKMRSDIEQANNTILTALGKYTTVKEKNKLLTEQIYNLEQAKQKEINEKETAIHKVSEFVDKQQHLEEEKTKLEEKNKLLTEQIYSLEHVKQKEINEKETAIHKISELVAKQQHLDQEKINLEEKYNILATRSAELKILLESEQCLRKAAEKSKIIEENTRKVEQEKISSAMKQANKTILSVLGHYATTEVSND
ncbi:MAG TPA: hypothetical protein VNK03_03220 [Gammaproteobacteria bacterium]|nr:hypothetical protein [Gammaproteobacteria bacterium]